MAVVRGPVCDAMNPAAAPSVRRLRNLGANLVRLTGFFDAPFFAYAEKLNANGITVDVAFPSESWTTDDYASEAAEYAERLPFVGLFLLGNEPNAGAGSASSWVMSPQEYADFWNRAAPAMKRVNPVAQCYVGGMLGDIGPWLAETMGLLTVPPDGIDVHYPESELTLIAYEEIYGLPLSVDEWCWAGRNVPRSSVVSWQRMLDRHAAHSCWFCWCESMGPPGMGLVSAKGRALKAFGDYQAALLDTA